jgi:hypothetical protein
MIGVDHDDIAALEAGTDRRGAPRPFLPSRGHTLPVTPNQVRRAVLREARSSTLLATPAFARDWPQHEHGPRAPGGRGGR